jgi:glycosyltransferase involved in cell wall biosynthesis
LPERIRVLAFVTVFEVGGTERQLVALTKGLDRSRFDIRVACFRPSGPFLAEIEAQGISVVSYPIRNLHGLNTIREQFRLARDLRRDRTEILHAFNFYPNMFAIPAARLAGVPVIIATLRDMGDLWTPMQRRAQRWVCRLAHRVVANAEAVREQAVSEGYDPGKVSVIRNGLDLSLLSTTPNHVAHRDALGVPPHVPVVAVFSRLNHNVKGISWYLDAAARVMTLHQDVQFLVVGDGPLRSSLEEQAARLGLGERIRFTGYRSDIAETMTSVSISVIPSESEGLSNVLLESMRAELPVIATRVGGTPEVIEDGQSGLLVPPRDAESLARAIISLLEDPARASMLARAGRRRVERLFDLGRMVRETESLYTEMLFRETTGSQIAAEHVR